MCEDKGDIVLQPPDLSLYIKNYKLQKHTKKDFYMCFICLLISLWLIIHRSLESDTVKIKVCIEYMFDILYMNNMCNTWTQW